MTRLELDLMEYTHTREGICEAEIDKHGPVGAHQRVTERAVLADIRAIMDGRPLPAGAE